MGEEEERPICKLDAKENNVDGVVALVTRTLLEAGKVVKAREFTERISSCVTYNEVLQIGLEYVKIV